jgi:hypothetical protein
MRNNFVSLPLKLKPVILGAFIKVVVQPTCLDTVTIRPKKLATT